MVIHEKAEKEQKRSRRVVQLNYLAVLPLLSPAFTYQPKKEAKKSRVSLSSQRRILG